MSEGETDVLAWLHANTTWTDIVLAPADIVPLMSALLGNRVVNGHSFETIRAKAKRTEEERFHEPGAAPTECQALLDGYCVRSLLYKGSTLNLEADGLGLELVWSGGEARWYRVPQEP